MKKQKGFKYTIEGFSDIDKFAKGILTLVNVQSSTQGSVVKLETFSGTNMVQVVSLSDIGMDLEQTMGQIKHVSEIDILSMEFDDLNDDGQDTVADHEDHPDDYHLHFIEY